LSVSLLPAVLATRTISLSKFTSGTLSATFHALTSFSKSLALVMTPFSGISLASFSSSIEPIQVLVALSGVGAATATPAARNITAARESHLHIDIARLLELGCHSQRKKPSMRLAVKLRQALLPIHCVSRGPSAPPLLGLSCLCPCLPQRSFPADAPRAAAPTRLPGRLACPRPGHNARTTVYPCGTGHGPKHPLPCTPLASGAPPSRAHPSNERCPPKAHPAADRRLSPTSRGLTAAALRRPRPPRRIARVSLRPAPHTAAARAWAACRRAVESTVRRQSFADAPCGHSPRSR